METELVRQGIDLMLYGMGTVFAFLTLLVLATVSSSYIVCKFFPEQAPMETKPTLTTAAATNAVDPVIIDAITQAIHQHRAKK